MSRTRMSLGDAAAMRAWLLGRGTPATMVQPWGADVQPEHVRPTTPEYVEPDAAAPVAERMATVAAPAAPDRAHDTASDAPEPAPPSMPIAMPRRDDYGNGGGVGMWLSALGAAIGRKPFDAGFWERAQQRGDQQYADAVQAAKGGEEEALRMRKLRADVAAAEGGGEMTPTQLAAQDRTERTRRLWDPQSEESQRARAAYIQAGGESALVDGRSFAEMDGDPAVRATIQRATEKERAASGASEYDRRADLQFRDWARRNSIDENDARARTIFEDAVARSRKMDEETRDEQREAPKAEAAAARDYGEELRARGVTRARAALDSVLEEMRLQGIDVDAALADPRALKADVPGYGQTGILPGGVLSPEGKSMRRAVKRLLDTELRVATGANAPPSEVDTFASILGVGSVDTDRDLLSALAQSKRLLDIQEGYVREMFPTAPQPKKQATARAPKPAAKPAPSVIAAPAGAKKIAYSPSANKTYWLDANGKPLQVADGDHR